MKNFNKTLNFNGIISLCTALLIFIVTGCSDGNNTQENDQQIQEEVVDTEVVEEVNNDEAEMEESSAIEENTVDQSAASEYVPSPDENKLVMGATSLSYKGLDTNNDGILNKDELFGGLYDLWDVDSDNVVDEEEFNASTQNFFIKNKVTPRSFDNWDMDSNGEISKEEFREEFASIVDVKENETLAQNLFIIWNQDNDGIVERIELENVIIRLDKDDN